MTFLTLNALSSVFSLLSVDRAWDYMGGTRCADGILRCRRARKRGQRPHCPCVDADGTYRRRVRVVVDSSRVRQYRGTGERERER